MKTSVNVPNYILILVLVFSLSFFSSEVFGQSILWINDVPGGGGSSTNQTPSSNDNTFIYVAGGLLIAGILAYALFIKKDNTEESDTTASVSNRLTYSKNINIDSENDELLKLKDRIPIDLFLGIKKSDALLNDNTYLVGLRFKL